MADVSKVKLPNGTIVNIKDETARANIKTYTLTQDASDGHKITLTPSSGTGQTITIPDNNTTYTFDTGANNGQIKVTPSGGTAQNVSVKGLGSAAYKAITDTYSSTGTDATSGKAVAAALGTLDGTVSGSAGASKTLTAFSQTDGKVSATFGNISITKSQVSDFPTLGTAAAKDFTTSVTSGSSNLVTSGAVYTAIDNLPEPMVFKGTLGTGGTITTLPTAAASNEGYTYKVITAGTYASQSAKVGDVFVSNGSAWVLIPAGDDVEDTWRAIKVNGTQLLGSAISTGAVNFKNGSNVTVTGSGNDITIAATDNNTTYTFANGTNGFTVTPSGGTAQTVTVTPSITNNITGSGTNGYIAKFNGANTITNAVALGSDTTKYLRNDGTWQVPSYPTVNNATLTIQKNGTNVQTFTANQGTNATANITVPTKTSELTNNSNFVTSDNATPYEAKLRWGGQNFTGSYGCIDAAMIDSLGANRLFGIKADAITIEYSRDTGATWTDYGAANWQKQALFVQGASILIGKADSTNKATANGEKYQLRITIDTGVGNIYTVLNKIVIYISTNGSSACKVKIQKALQSTPTTFVDHTDFIDISGWSGYNVLNISGLTTYGNTASSQYGRVRFIFKANGGNTNYNGLNVNRIMGFGGVGWATPSTMASTGHLYAVDQDLNASFPAQVSATKFNGTATNADKVNNLTVQTAVPANAEFTDTQSDWNATSGKAVILNKPTIPTVNNAKLTIQKNGTTVKTFTANASSNVTANITVPTAGDSATTGISIADHSTGSITGVQSSTTTASKVTLGTAISVPNVTNVGSASTWAFENITVPKAASSATSIPNVTAVGSGSFTATVTNGVLSFSHVHTAPTLGTAISVTGVSGSTTASHVKSGGNGTAPTLGTAISVPNVTAATDVTVPIKNTSSTTVVTSKTHTVTDNGHTHTLS